MPYQTEENNGQSAVPDKGTNVGEGRCYGRNLICLDVDQLRSRNGVFLVVGRPSFAKHTLGAAANIRLADKKEPGEDARPTPSMEFELAMGERLSPTQK